MLLLCDESVVLPLKIIFSNILSSAIYPEPWKFANVIPIFKNKQLIKNYRPISLLPVCGKILEKIIFNNLYNYFTTNNLQSDFRPGDSTTNQLMNLVNQIHQSFDDIKSLEVRTIFLDISKAFDKVWHDGFMFKLKQNDVSGSLLKQNDVSGSLLKQNDVSGSLLKQNDVSGSLLKQNDVSGSLLKLLQNYLNNRKQRGT